MAFQLSTKTTAEEFAILKNVKLRRESLRYTQAYVAKKICKTQHAYSRIECGSIPLSVKDLFGIAKALNCCVVNFLEK